MTQEEKIEIASQEAIGGRGIVPQSAVKRMDDTIIKNINDRVGRKDRLYHCGDFAFAYDKVYLETCREYRDRINCQNIFMIFGNHDKEILGKAGFIWATPAKVVEINGTYIHLSHNPIFPGCWDRSHYGSWHLFGHVHGSLDGHRIGEFKSVPPWALMLDVGVDSHNFFPWHFEEIREHMNKKCLLLLKAVVTKNLVVIMCSIG